MHFLKSAWFGGITIGRMRWNVEDALIHAAMRADAMVETGDLDGYAVWKRVIKAVIGWTVGRFHGAGGGAPKGNRNGQYRHGLYTQEAIAERRALSALLRVSANLSTLFQIRID